MARRCLLTLALVSGCFIKPDPPATGDGGMRDGPMGDMGIHSHTRRRRIEITRPAITGTATLKDFPVNVALVDSDLATYVIDQAELVFTAIDGAPLAYEIDSYISGAGRLAAWVRVPTLPASGTTIYLYYAGPPVANDPKSVWSDAYAVWHMNGANDELDVAGNVSPLRGTVGSIPAVRGGVFGAARYYDSAKSDHLCVSQSNVLPFGSQPFSVSMWVDPAIVSSFDAPFWRGGDGTSPGVTFELGDGPWQAIARDSNAVAITGEFGPPSAAGWVHLAFSVDNPADEVLVSRDGGPVLADPVVALGAIPSANSFCLGRTEYRYGGGLDEVRVWKTAQPLEWYATEYANAKEPSFMTIGPVEVVQ